MPFQTNRTGIRESLLDALRAALITKLADFQTVLSAAPALSVTYLGQTIAQPLGESQIFIGDFDTLPDPTSTPMWVTIEGGGKQDGTDWEIKRQATGGIYDNTLRTNIYWYLHPEIFPIASAFTQAELRTRLRARFEDWLIGDALNVYSAQKLTLNSQQFSPGSLDFTADSNISRVSCGYSNKGAGHGTWIFSAHFEHVCNLRGPM